MKYTRFYELSRSFDLDRYRSALTILFAVMLAGRDAEARETILVRNGISQEQADDVAYQNPFRLPVSARRSKIVGAGTTAPLVLQRASEDLAEANLNNSDLFNHLHELGQMKAGLLAEIVHTLDEIIRSTTKDVPEAFFEFTKVFEDAAHVIYTTPELAILQNQLLECRPGDDVFMVSDFLGPTLHQLVQNREIKLHFQTPTREVERDVRMLCLLSKTAVQVSLQEPLMNPLTCEEGLRRFERVMIEPPLLRRLERVEVDHLNKDPHHRFRFGDLHRNTRELALAQHGLAVLKNQGVATLFAPSGVLFRGGREGNIRKSLLTSDVVEAIIALPSGIVQNSGITSVLLKLVANKDAARRGQVMLVVVPPSSHRKVSALTPEVIERAHEAITSWTAQPGFARIVTLEEMAQHDFVLQPNRFIDDFKPPPRTDWVTASERLSCLENDARGFSTVVDKMLFSPLSD